MIESVINISYWNLVTVAGCYLIELACNDAWRVRGAADYIYHVLLTSSIDTSLS